MRILQLVGNQFESNATTVSHRSGKMTRFISGRDGGTGATEEKKREEFSERSAENKKKREQLR